MQRRQSGVSFRQMFVNIAQQFVDHADREPAPYNDGVRVDDHADMLDRNGKMRTHFLKPPRNKRPAMRVECKKVLGYARTDAVLCQEFVEEEERHLFAKQIDLLCGLVPVIGNRQPTDFAAQSHGAAMAAAIEHEASAQAGIDGDIKETAAFRSKAVVKLRK